MVKKYLIKLHSMVDVITNSSTELFIVDISQAQSLLFEIFELIKETVRYGHSETTIKKAIKEKLERDYIIPEDMDFSGVYEIRVDYGDAFLRAFIEKYFTIVKLEDKY